MKINPNLIVIQGHKQTTVKRDVQARLRPNHVSTAKAQVLSNKLKDVVFLENRRAASEMPCNQEEVERLLQELQVSLKQMTRDEQRHLYRLEGLVHAFPV